MSETRAITALIPSYRPHGPDLERLIAALTGHGIEAVVLANSETALQMAISKGLHHLSPNENLGFGPAINWAVGRLPDWSWLLLVNDDIILEAGGLERVLPEVGEGSAAEVLYLDADVERPIPGPFAVFANLSLLARLLERVRMRRGPVRQRLGTYRSFSCVLISRRAWTELQGFDPRMPFTYEDADFIRRLRAVGGVDRLIDGAQLRHDRSSTSTSNVRTVLPVASWSAARYLAKWSGGRAARARLTVQAALVLRLALLPFGRASKRAHVSGVLRALAAITRGRAPALPPYSNVTS